MSSEDWGYDPYVDDHPTGMTLRWACRHCQHAVDQHNLEWGCRVCTCMATPGEAYPMTTEQEKRPILRVTQCLPQYSPRIPEVDCGVVQHIGLPRAVVGRCIGPKGHRSKAHSFRPVSPISICGHPHRDSNKWCVATPGHLGTVHDYVLVPPAYVNHTPPHSRKDADMKTAAQIERELRAVQESEELLAARKAELQRLLDARAALPSEPDYDSVIKFRCQFDPNGIVYTFIATRTRRDSSKQWYTTGTRPNHKGPLSWDDILNLMHEDVGVKTGVTQPEFFLFDGGKWIR